MYSVRITTPSFGVVASHYRFIPRLSFSVNIHSYSPPLRLILLKSCYVLWSKFPNSFYFNVIYKTNRCRFSTYDEIINDENKHTKRLKEGTLIRKMMGGEGGGGGGGAKIFKQLSNRGGNTLLI